MIRRLPFRHDGGLAFAAQRFELWTRFSARIRPAALRAFGIRMQGQVPRPATAVPCIPQAGDWFVLKQWKQRSTGLVACAGSLGETVGQTAERLVKYAPFMVGAPTFDAAVASFIPGPDDVIFLSRDADGEAPWLEGTPDVIHTMNVARVLGRSVDSILAQYPRYQFLGIRAPTISREELEAMHPKDEADRLLLTGTLDEQGRRQVKQISFMWLVQTAVRTRRPLGSLLDRLRAFEKVGVTSALLDFVPTAAYQPDELDLRDLKHISTVSGGSIGLGPLLKAIVKGGGARLFATARRLGLLPATCSDEVIAGLAIDEVDARILSYDGDGLSPWIGRKVPRSHIGHLARRVNIDEQDLVRRVQRLAPLGVELLEEGELQVL